MNTLVLLFALGLGLVNADADAQFYNGFYNYPYASTYNTLGYSNFGYGNIHTYGKREAEADPMHHFYSAMPYYHQAAYAAYKPVTYVKPMEYKPMHFKSYSNDAVKPMGYAAKGMYKAETAGSVHIAKREAEPYTIGYNTYQTSPLSYVSAPIVTPFKPYTYGIHHMGKRDAEADAQYFNYPMTYGYNFGYSHYPYTTSAYHYGKREAEAEPQFYGNYYGNRAFTYGGYGSYPYASTYGYGMRYYG